ncbi:hypothetical protein DFH09DRAFT_1424911 [Mycena vulgaris]|nr:hypothetical protein DFH09DRAFT_1424911 [Mycena vulgaris]
MLSRRPSLLAMLSLCDTLFPLCKASIGLGLPAGYWASIVYFVVFLAQRSIILKSGPTVPLPPWGVGTFQTSSSDIARSRSSSWAWRHGRKHTYVREAVTALVFSNSRMPGIKRNKIQNISKPDNAFEELGSQLKYVLHAEKKI